MQVFTKNLQSRVTGGDEEALESEYSESLQLVDRTNQMTMQSRQSLRSNGYMINPTLNSQEHRLRTEVQ